MTAPYPPPVDRLLTLGAEPARRRVWPDYRLLGLEERHVPALVRMAADPAAYQAQGSAAVWAPVHAWRALGQMEAAAAAGPLLEVLERERHNSWVYDEVPAVLGMIGAPALPGATLLLFDEARDDDLRGDAARVISQVAHQYPERRDECAAVLATQLGDWAHQGPVLNACLVGELAELEQADAAPLMQAAFEAGAVDLSVSGDWEDVQVQMGLLEERLTPPPPGSLNAADWAFAPQPARRPSASAEAKARARRKAGKQSRKQNRKKKK